MKETKAAKVDLFNFNLCNPCTKMLLNGIKLSFNSKKKLTYMMCRR
jgi:hypothetical protein